MKKTIALCLLSIALPSIAQISLDEERNRNSDLQIQEAMSNEIQYQSNNKNNSIVNNIDPTSEEAQKAKFANMSQFILMNAAVVGYGQACGFPNGAVTEIKDFIIKRYELQNEKYILRKYEDKINEFKNSNPKDDECKIFRKEFNSILSKVREFN